VNIGCFSGDAAGLPVTINGAAGRSYRLTGDLTVPDENTNGIVVSANDIGIDLNNFAIIGPVTCSRVGPFARDSERFVVRLLIGGTEKPR
jgi:hypothetical protein